MKGRRKCLRMALPFQGLAIEALLPAPAGADRFVIRATHERGVGVPSSRSLATASREAETSVVRPARAVVRDPSATFSLRDGQTEMSLPLAMVVLEEEA